MKTEKNELRFEILQDLGKLKKQTQENIHQIFGPLLPSSCPDLAMTTKDHLNLVMHSDCDESEHYEVSFSVKIKRVA